MRIATIIANFSKAPAMCGSKIARRHGAYDRHGELGESIGLAATTQTAELLEALGTDRDGLDAKRADELRAEVGGNVPTRVRRTPAALRLAKSLASPFSLILAALAAISLYTNVIAAAPGEEDPSTCIIIAVMVLISGILGFVQEDRGIAAAESLRTLVTTTCRLKRAGEPAREVPFAELVPGDIVLLAAGDLIPADARVIEAKDLFVNQTALTGESEPVEKDALPCDADAGALTVGDCTSIVFTGTTVVSGSARAVVVATGDATYVGRVMRTVRERPARTSFDAGVASVSRVLVGFMLVMCPIVFVINGITKGDWLDALLFTASVAVGITPQMLPVIVTTCLARGAREMARREVIVKDLSAIQNLGAMDVLCCDKTGTLTEDRVVLERHLNADGEKDDRVLRHAFLVSHFQTGLRNLIDEAIEERGLALARSGSPELAGAIERWHKVDEVPFDFERRRMSVVVEDAAGKTQMVTKGAVEEVLAACSHVELDGRALPLDEGRRARVLADAARMNDEGLRVIAVAQRTDPRPVGAFSAA
ncbi:HAD-IC family P-type ATPase, partial [Candidatus Collinsella stercoripullorum]|uniref:HAD-IC family P-type ATPase n=1 Tax=Candidatus Collinsella stercoripullorum TaxID=2838522 RepID=UPI0022E90EC2